MSVALLLGASSSLDPFGPLLSILLDNARSLGASLLTNFHEVAFRLRDAKKKSSFLLPPQLFLTEGPLAPSS